MTNKGFSPPKMLFRMLLGKMAAMMIYKRSELNAASQPNIGDLRVCFVVESGTDVRLVEGMSERFDLTVLARKIVAGGEISQIPSRPLKLIVGSASRIGFARAVFCFLRKRRQDFDHIVVQGYGFAALAANLAGRLSAIPTTMLICSPIEAYYRCRAVNPVGENRPFLKSELMAVIAAARVNARLGSRYVVLSHYLSDIVRGHGTHGVVDIVPVYGVDTKLFCPTSDLKSSIKSKRGLPTDGSIIFFSSRVAPEKDANTLLMAMRDLLDRGRELWLLHRSGGYESLLAMARGFGIEKQVIATDAVHPQKGLADDYRASDVCVQASREEGLGFSVLEAMACGVPVIAANIGGLKETVLDGYTGWQYPVGEHLRLANCIVAALDDPVESARRAAAGREMVNASFTRDAVFSKFEAVLRSNILKVGLREMLRKTTIDDLIIPY